MDKTAVIAITKNGIERSYLLQKHFPSFQVFAPAKFYQEGKDVQWFEESTNIVIKKLFESYDSLVCIFSLGAVIRLVAPFLKDKKTDPAVVVIDDAAKFVISTLSGHLGGANELAQKIASAINATPVITTAADVNKTIAVDLLGKEFGWTIDDYANVTKVSAQMVNEEKIGVFQDAGETCWWLPKKELPQNVLLFNSLEELAKSDCRGFLIISDKINDVKKLQKPFVMYRPKTLVIGVGLHWDTTKETIKEGLEFCLSKFNLSGKSIAKLVSIKKDIDVKGLKDLAEDMKIPVEYYDKNELQDVKTPNPSDVVKSFEGTPSVSEAAAIKASAGTLIVQKHKFPPNLTIAIARIAN